MCFLVAKKLTDNYPQVTMRVATHLFPYCYWYLLVLVHVLCQSL